MLFPKLVPAGTHYVRIPNSKRAAMRILLETVQRGSRYWLSGTVAVGKALGFAEKMAKRYRADATQAQRAYAKSKKQANTTLVMFPEDVSTVRWWLLATPGKGAVHAEERLLDAHDRRGRLRWADQYELVHELCPRSMGGGQRWTWCLTAPRHDALAAAMHELASAHGREPGRRDDLDALVQSLLRLPGFHGVRQQVLALLRLGKQAWGRTHRQGDVYPWPETVPYLDKSFGCYHVPEPLRLDVLARWMLSQGPQ
jgi:hypothetical protein